MAGRPRAAPFDVREGLAEFADLNRRRLFGTPALSIAELERWLDLRSRLEAHFDARRDPGWRGVERRQFQRLPTHLQVDLRTVDDLRSGTVRDVSQGGLFIATRRPLEVGSRLRLLLSPGPGEPPLELAATVTWVRQTGDDESEVGMGVEFGVLDAEQRGTVSRLLEQAAACQRRGAPPGGSGIR